MVPVVFIVGILTLVLFGVLAFIAITSLRNDAWEGNLADKIEETYSGKDYEQKHYMLYVKATDGTKKRVMVRKRMYNQFNIGDRLVKVKGKAYPQKAEVQYDLETPNFSLLTS